MLAFSSLQICRWSRTSTLSASNASSSSNSYAEFDARSMTTPLLYSCMPLSHYCISLLAATPRTLTDKLQRVMNAAARIISNTRKFDHGLTNLRHDVLHWLDVSDRITFRQCVQVFQCLRGMAPSYRNLSELCRLESEL